MKIYGEDFELIKDSSCYTLYLKNKDGKMKVFGYYVKIVPAIKAVRRYRRYKKYPFKFTTKELTNFINDYELYENKLRVLSLVPYRSIYKLIEDKIAWQMYG